MGWPFEPESSAVTAPWLTEVAGVAGPTNQETTRRWRLWPRRVAAVVNLCKNYRKLSEFFNKEAELVRCMCGAGKVGCLILQVCEESRWSKGVRRWRILIDGRAGRWRRLRMASVWEIFKVVMSLYWFRKRQTKGRMRLNYLYRVTVYVICKQKCNAIKICNKKLCILI